MLLFLHFASEYLQNRFAIKSHVLQGQRKFALSVLADNPEKMCKSVGLMYFLFCFFVFFSLFAINLSSIWESLWLLAKNNKLQVHKLKPFLGCLTWHPAQGPESIWEWEQSICSTWATSQTLVPSHCGHGWHGTWPVVLWSVWITGEQIRSV